MMNRDIQPTFSSALYEGIVRSKDNNYTTYSFIYHKSEFNEYSFHKQGDNITDTGYEPIELKDDDYITLQELESYKKVQQYIIDEYQEELNHLEKGLWFDVDNHIETIHTEINKAKKEYVKTSEEINEICEELIIKYRSNTKSACKI